MWRKSSRSSQQGDCVELAALVTGVGVRDSKLDGTGPILRLSRGELGGLLAAAKEGALDL